MIQTDLPAATDSPPPSATPPMAPVAEPERIVGLDVLRGLAIFGILMVNIGLFAMPVVTALDPGPLADASWQDRACWAVVRGGFEYKFVSLFSLLFGAGLMVQMSRAAQRGVPFAPLYVRRLLLLMSIGLVHGFLLWYGDILFMYACVGLLAFLLRNTSNRAMLWVAGIGLGLTVLITAAAGVMGVLFTPDDAPAAATTTTSADPAADAGDNGTLAADLELVADGARDLVSGGDRGPDTTETAEPGVAPPALAPRESEPEPRSQWDRYRDAWKEAFNQDSAADFGAAETIAFKEGPFLLAFVHRALLYTAILIMTGVFGGFMLRVLAFFLIGMMLMRAGFFESDRRRWHRMAFAGGMLVGLPGEILLVSAYFGSDFKLSWLTATAETFHVISSGALCLGYVGGVMLLVGSGAGALLARPLGAVGRMALSNYILQTIVATGIMYWWGLALFGELDRPSQLSLAVLIFAGQLIISPLWLRWFTMGPLEWAWRALTYRRKPAFRRRPATTGMHAQRDSGGE